MTEAPKPYPELLITSRHPGAEYQTERTHPIWHELRLHPPQLIAVLSDSLQYVVDDENRIVGFEVSDNGQDRIDAAVDIHQEFPDSSLITLSTSFDNIIEHFPDCSIYQLSMILTGGVLPGNFILPEGRTYDTLTELIEIARAALSPVWGNFENVAIIAGAKQARRASVMLDTLRFADDPKERERFDRYFEVYMPRRLATTPQSRVHEAFADYKTIAHKDVLLHAAELRRKTFMIVSSEDITGTRLAEDEHDTNLQGTQDWLDGTYGHKYVQPQTSNPKEVSILVRRASVPTERPRIRIPFAGTPEAKEQGIGWGLAPSEL